MTINIPPEIKYSLEQGGPLIVSVSGGKDSDAMTLDLSYLRKMYGWAGDFILIHADVGRMEWHSSLEHCAKLAKRVGAEFVVVRHPKYDLAEGIRQRFITRPDAPSFPSSKSRYCTSDWKRAPISKWIRNTYVSDVNVVCAIGLRAEESAARAKKDPCSFRSTAIAPTKNRVVYDWLPIHDYTLEQVWETIGISLEKLAEFQEFYRKYKYDHEAVKAVLEDFPAHEAYLYGNERVSCSLCVLASKNDLKNGREHQPDTYELIRGIEEETGYTFRSNANIEELTEGIT